MIKYSNNTLFVFFSVLTILVIYWISPILTPFIFGALLAYLSDPLVRKLHKRKIPHLLSVIIVFTALLLFFLLFIVMLVPLIQIQLVQLGEVIPNIYAWVQETILPTINQVVSVENLKTGLATAIPRSGAVVETILKSGYTMVLWAANIILIPVVTFYLLRDWDLILNKIKQLLPASIKPTVIELAQQCDEVLGAFFRGQLLVMLALGLIYGIGLTVIGLQVGLMIGLIGGLLSIVPYLGSLFVVVFASLAALVQFGTIESVFWVLGVFLIGQAVEGYILTPYLVGERIGLHPVMVIFAVMAGGALFGFFGVLIALPAAALIKVLLMYARKHYQKRTA